MKKILISLSLSAVLIAGCKTMSIQNKVNFPTFSTEGHRGARGLMPENSLPAMKKAIDLGVTTLEMDTHISSDGKVFLAHDHYVNPIFTLDPDGKEIPASDNKKYAFYQMPYDQIRRYDVGSKPHPTFPQQEKLKTHMPLLEELFDYVQDYLKSSGKKQVFYNIETKSSNAAGDDKLHPGPEEFADKLVAVIKAKKMEAFTVVQSFDMRTIQAIHRKYPEIRTSFLVDNNKSFEENMKALGYTPFIFSPHQRLVNAELIKKAHALNMKVIPWTPNTAEDINRMRSLGVDGIISDYPNLLVN